MGPHWEIPRVSLEMSSDSGKCLPNLERLGIHAKDSCSFGLWQLRYFFDILTGLKLCYLKRL